MPTPPPSQSTKDTESLGITFNEIHSDEPHEAVDGGKAEVPTKYAAGVDSHLTDRNKVFDVESAFTSDRDNAGTIVSDRKRATPAISEGFATALSEWWHGTKTGITKMLEPAPVQEEVIEEQKTVAKAETRADIIKEAIQPNALAPKNDHHVVIEQFRTFKQDSARASGVPYVVKNHVPEKNAWVHVVDDVKKPEPEKAKVVTSVPTPPARASVAIPQPPKVVPPPIIQKAVAKPSVPPPPKVAAVAKPVHAPHITVPDSVPKRDVPLPKSSVHIAPIVTMKTAQGGLNPSAQMQKPGQVKAPLNPALQTQVAKPKIAPAVAPIKGEAPKVFESPITPQVPTQKSKAQQNEVPSSGTAPLMTASSPAVAHTQISKPQIAPIVPQTKGIPPPPPTKKVPPPEVKIGNKVARPGIAAVVRQIPTAERPPVLQRTEEARPVVTLNTPSPVPHAIEVPKVVPPPPVREKVPVKQPSEAIKLEAPRTEETAEEAIDRTPAPRFRSTGSVPNPPEQRPVSTDTIHVSTLTPERHTSRTLLIWVIGGGIIFIGAVLAVILSVYMHKTPEDTGDQNTDIVRGTVSVPNFFVPKTTTPISLSSGRAVFLEDLTNAVTSAFEVTQFYPTLPLGDTSRPATSDETFGILAISLDGKTQRALNDVFMIGSVMTTKNEPFIILQSYNFDVLFSGMLAWEPMIYTDFMPLFGTQAVDVQRFTDGVHANKSIRVLKNTTGADVLLYSFIDQNTVVITTSREALTKVIEQY